jgi:hypothetical protein
VAKRLRRELSIDVEMVTGHYGEFKVLIDDQTVIDAGAAAFVGVLPSARKIIETVRAHLNPV